MAGKKTDKALVKQAEAIRNEWDAADVSDLTRAKGRGDALVKLRNDYAEHAKEHTTAAKWGDWCEEYIGRSYRACREYVQIAEAWDKVKGCQSIREARELLKTPRGPKNTNKRTPATAEPLTLTDDDRQRLAASLSSRGITAIPDAVLAAVVAAGFKIVRTSSPATSTPTTPAAPTSGELEVDAHGNIVPSSAA